MAQGFSANSSVDPKDELSSGIYDLDLPQVRIIKGKNLDEWTKKEARID